jgi:hypothetical protein
MSQENVEAFKRFLDAFNRRDVEAMLEEVDAGVEWRPAAPVALGGEATVYRGHAGIPATQIRSYLDPREAREAAGLRE